jgi:hypothetical protein
MKLSDICVCRSHSSYNHHQNLVPRRELYRSVGPAVINITVKAESHSILFASSYASVALTPTDTQSWFGQVLKTYFTPIGSDPHHLLLLLRLQRWHRASTRAYSVMMMIAV